MPETRCQVCQSPATGLMLCQVHVTYLKEALDELPWLCQQLDVTVTKQDKLHQTQGRSEKSTRSVFNAGAANLRDDVHATLLGWTLNVLNTDRIEFTGTPAHHARFLAKHVNALAGREDAKDFYFDVISFTGDPDHPDVPGRLVSAINRRSRVYAGPCGTEVGFDNEGNPVICNTPLYGIDENPDVTCPRCDVTVNVAANQRRAAENRDLMPEKAVVEWMSTLGEPVSPSTLQQWITKRRLNVHGYLSKGEVVPDKPAYHAPRVVSLAQARALRVQVEQEQLAEVAS